MLPKTETFKNRVRTWNEVRQKAECVPIFSTEVI